MILLNDIDQVIEDGDEVRDYPESHHWGEDRARKAWWMTWWPPYVDIYSTCPSCGAILDPKFPDCNCVWK